MIDLSQNTFGHEYVLKALKENRIIKYKYYLLDREENNMGEISNAECSIDFNSGCEIMRTANFRMKETDFREINPIDEKIRPMFCIKMPSNDWLEYPLGTFILSSPRRLKSGPVMEREIDAYDTTIVLREDKFDTRFYIPPGTNYVWQIESILETAGIRKANLSRSELTTPAPIEFEIGTSKLEAINQLLRAVNYTPLHFDGNGFATSYKYIEPAARKVDHIYRTDQESIIRVGTEQNADLFNVPNVFVRYVENPDAGELFSKFINDDPGNILSTVRRGRRIVDIDTVEDIADQATLADYTRRVAIEKSTVYESVYLPTSAMPNHGYQDCVFLQQDEFGTNAKYIEESWNMDLSVGGSMNHRLRKVVAFDVTK